MGLNESKREYIKKLEKMKEEILDYRERINVQTDDFVRTTNKYMDIIKEVKEENRYIIKHGSKSDSYCFTTTKDHKEFITKDMTYDEAYKIIRNNDLKYYHNNDDLTPGEILSIALNNFYSCAELTGTIKEPIFFEMKSR